MLNILYLNPTAEIGGAEISLLLLLRSLNKKHFRPIVILPCLGPLQNSLSSNGIEIITRPLKKINIRNPLPYLYTIYRLTKLMRQLSIGLIHCNMEICNQYAFIAARLNGLPIVCHTRNILSKRAFQRMFLGGADVLIANSKATASSYTQYVSKDQRVEIIYNAADCVQFYPEGECNLRSRFNINNNGFVIGLIGQITPNKGQDVFIRALAQVVRKHPNVRALVVGDTVIDDSKWFLVELKQLVQELGISDKVIFTGFVKNITDLYRCLDIVVLPSRSEGFGRTIAEAMAMGKPVIASRVGGLPELISEGETGLLVPPGDSNSLADAIVKLVENRSLAKKLGFNGRRKVKEQFSVEKNVRKIERVYMSLLSNSGNGHDNCSTDAEKQ